MSDHEQFSTIVGSHFVGLTLHNDNKLLVTVINLVGVNTAYQKEFNNEQLPMDIKHIFINIKILYDYISENCTNQDKVAVDTAQGNALECQMMVNSIQMVRGSQVYRKTVLKMPKQNLVKEQQQQQQILKQQQKQINHQSHTRTIMKNEKDKKELRIQPQHGYHQNQISMQTFLHDDQYSNKLVDKVLKRLNQKTKKIIPMKKTVYMCRKAIGLIKTGCSLRTIALQLKVSEWNARKLKEQFANTGNIKPDATQQIYIGKSQGKSDVEMIRQMIIQVLHSKPYCPVNQMRLKLKSKGIERSNTSVRRYMQSLKMKGNLSKQDNTNFTMHYPQNSCLSLNEGEQPQKYNS